MQTLTFRPLTDAEIVEVRTQWSNYPDPFIENWVGLGAQIYYIGDDGCECSWICTGSGPSQSYGPTPEMQCLFMLWFKSQNFAGLQPHEFLNQLCETSS